MSSPPTSEIANQLRTSVESPVSAGAPVPGWAAAVPLGCRLDPFEPVPADDHHHAGEHNERGDHGNRPGLVGTGEMRDRGRGGCGERRT